MKKIAIMGSTGSIGTQTLEVVRENKDIEVDVSISHVKDNAIAMAVAEYKKEGI